MNTLLSFYRYAALALAAVVVGSPAAFAAAPAAPQNLAIEITYPDNPSETMTAALSWEASDSADGYRIYVKQLDEEWQNGQYELFAETGETSYDLDDLDIGTAAYAYFVKAYNGDGESSPSNSVSSACGRPWNDGDLGEYNGSGITAIVTTPAAQTTVQREYRYDVNTFADYSAANAAGIEYSVSGPEGMTINPATGVVSWTPQAAGHYLVTVTAQSTALNELDQQMWELEVMPDGVTSVGEPATGIAVTTYPNPAISHMTVQFASEAGTATLALVDAQGTELHRRTVQTAAGSTTVSLDISDLAAGRYFLRLAVGAGSTTVPVSVVK